MLDSKQAQDLKETLLNIDTSLHLLKDAIVALQKRVTDLENNK